MADTHMFSVRRPREVRPRPESRSPLSNKKRKTLGNINNVSAIPMPSSAMKRSQSVANLSQPPHTAQHARSTSSARMSMMGRPSQPVFQRSSSGADLANNGFSTVQRPSTSNMFSSTGRKSYAPMGSATPASALQLGESAQRRSSVYMSRPSSMAQGSQGPRQSFFQTAPMPATVPQDPRRLRDASVRAKMAEELQEYLSRNNFEMDTMHSLGPKSFTSPTQKDFEKMFQWLYHRIDPTYRFSGKMDADVPALLKQLRYPFEKSITKSQIAAVGGNNWHTFLGLLHWMMQLVRMMDAFSTGVYDEAIAEAGHDVSGDRIIFDFLSDAYKAFLSVDDGEEDEDPDKVVAPYVVKMAERFDQANAHHLEDVKMLEAEFQALQDQIDELEKHGPKISKLTKEIKVLEEDMVKFEDFNNKVQKKLDKYPKRLEILEEEIKKVEAELEEVEQEKGSLQETLDSQGLTIADIDRMASERERLQKNIETTAARLDETKKKTSEKESEASKKLEELERAIDKYNTMGYQIGIIPPTAPNAKGQNYELSLTLSEGPNFSSSQMGASSQGMDSDRLLAENGVGYQPHHLLNLDLRGAIKNNIILLRKEISERRNAALEQDLKHHDLLDEIREAIDDKQAEVEGLGHKVRAAEEEFEKTREITTAQKLTSDAQIERMEKELARMRSGLTESVQLMEQREMNTNIAYEQLTLKASALREELHTGINNMLNDIIRFKIHVQESLEGYEQFVAEEVEREILEGEMEGEPMEE